MTPKAARCAKPTNIGGDRNGSIVEHR